MIWWGWFTFWRCSSGIYVRLRGHFLLRFNPRRNCWTLRPLRIQIQSTLSENEPFWGTCWDEGDPYHWQKISCVLPWFFYRFCQNWEYLRLTVLKHQYAKHRFLQNFPRNKRVYSWYLHELKCTCAVISDFLVNHRADLEFGFGCFNNFVKERCFNFFVLFFIVLRDDFVDTTDGFS